MCIRDSTRPPRSIISYSSSWAGNPRGTTASIKNINSATVVDVLQRLICLLFIVTSEFFTRLIEHWVPVYSIACVENPNEYEIAWYSYYTSVGYSLPSLLIISLKTQSTFNSSAKISTSGICILAIYLLTGGRPSHASQGLEYQRVLKTSGGHGLL